MDSNNFNSFSSDVIPEPEGVSIMARTKTGPDTVWSCDANGNMSWREAYGDVAVSRKGVITAIHYDWVN